MKFGEKRKVSVKSFMVGVGEFIPYGINLSKAEKDAFTGFESEESPIYNYVNEQGVRCVNIVVYGETKIPDGFKKTQLHFSLQDRSVTSATGKERYIDAYGNTTWSEGVPVDDRYFHTGQCRPCKIGEERFMKFFLAYCGHPEFKSDATMAFDVVANGETFLDLEKIFNNDFADFNAHIKKAQNSIGVYYSYGFDDNGNPRQVTYTDRFCNDVTNTAAVNSLLKSVTRDTGTGKYDFKHAGEIQGPLKLVVNPTQDATDDSTPDTTPTFLNTESSDTESSDGLPF